MITLTGSGSPVLQVAHLSLRPSDKRFLSSKPTRTPRRSDRPPPGASTGFLQVQHGGSILFNFTGFDDPANNAVWGTAGRGLWNAFGGVTYDVVPEPSGALLLSFAGALGLLRRRRPAP